MYKKVLHVFFAVLFLTIILCSQSTQATVNFPNTSIFTTYAFSLDLDGNGELLTTTRYQYMDDNFDWYSNTQLEIPIQITSFSKEKPNLTEVSVGGNSLIFNYFIRNYTISTIQDDSTYIHKYSIEVLPKNSYYVSFFKDQLMTIKTRTEINQLSSKTGDYGKFVFYFNPENFSPFIQSIIIKVNLPNDPYYWEEILDTHPKDDFRSSFGRGHTVEWWYKAGSNYRSPIIIDYKIHPDQTKRDLDKATKNSLMLGYFALLIALISIRSEIFSIINWIYKK